MVEEQEISGKVKQVITNTVSVKRTAGGLTIEVNSPEIHAWLKEHGEMRPPTGSPRAGWPREGNLMMPTAGFRLPMALENYGGAYVLLDDNTVNLAILRHEKAATGPVSYTSAGLFSHEEAQRILQAAMQTLATIFRDHMREYSGTATIKIIR